MAIESVSVTPGAGKDIAVDTVAGKELQVIKLALGAEDALDTLVDSGQQTMANSVPVVLASNQTAIPGAATEAEQQTQSTALAAIQTAVQTLDNAIAGSEMQVDVLTLPPLPAGTNNIGDVDVLTLPALPTGTNSIGQVTANAGANLNTSALSTSAKQSDGSQKSQIVDGSGNVIGATANALDVNIKSGASAGTQYTEDTPAAANPVGTAISLVRADSLSGVTSDDGDNVAVRGTDKGELYVKHVDSIAVSSVGGSVAVTSTNLTALVAATVVDDAAFTGGANRVGMMGARFNDSTPDSVDEGDGGAVRMSANRNLYSTIRDAGGNERGANVNASNQLSVSVDNTITVSSHAVTNAGTFVTQENGAALTALQLLDDTIVTDDAAYTPGTTKVGMAGFQADESSTDSVDEGDAGAARMTLDRKQIVTDQPHSAGGLSTFKLNSAASTNATVVKASPGTLYGWFCYNSHATLARKIAFHNTASTPTAGASLHSSFVIPPLSAANVLGGKGIEFTAGIAITTVTGLAENDSTGVAANDLIINLYFK